jgi:hypothetical protein
LRKAHVFILLIAACVLAIAGLFASSAVEVSRSTATLRETAALMRSLRLSDLCLSTDARYTRNPSQADVFTPFQDYPGSIEHFPTGSIVPPPDFGGLGTRLTVRR